MNASVVWVIRCLESIACTYHTPAIQCPIPFSNGPKLNEGLFLCCHGRD